LLRYLEEHAEATIEDAAVVAVCLGVLGSDAHEEAARTLRAMAERAARRRRARGVA
jgi:hypothetical protein